MGICWVEDHSEGMKLSLNHSFVPFRMDRKAAYSVCEMRQIRLLLSKQFPTVQLGPHKVYTQASNQITEQGLCNLSPINSHSQRQSQKSASTALKRLS
jgi:hypothetical protein